MSDRIGQAVLYLRVDDQEYTLALQNAKGAAQDLDTKTKENTDSIAASWKSMVQAAEIGAMVEAIRKIIEVSQEMLDEFAKDERATISMTAALVADTNATSGTALSMHNWAEELQRTTTFSHDLIESQVVMLSGMNMTESRMKQILTAAMNLSAAGFGPLDQMVTGLARSLETGSAGMLGRHIPAIAAMTKAQLLHGDAIAWVEQHYPTMASAIASSTEGLQVRMTNLINEQKSKIGEVVAQAYAGAEKLQGSIDTAGTIAANVVSVFIKSTETLVAWMKFQYDLFFGTMRLIAELVIAVAKTLWAPIEYAFHGTILTIENAFIDAFNFVLAQGTALVHDLGQVLSSATGGVLGKGLIGLDLGQIQKIKDEGVKPLGDAIKKIWTDAGNQAKDFYTSTVKGISELGDAWKQQGKTIEDTIKGVQAASAVGAGGAADPVKTLFGTGMEGIQGAVTDVQAVFGTGMEGIKGDVQALAETWEDALKRITAETKDQMAFGTALVKSFSQEIGQDLANGELSWKSLGSAALHSIGKIVSALGDQLAAMAAADTIKGLAAMASIIGAPAAPGFFAAAAVETAGAAAAWTAGAALESVKLEKGGGFDVPPGYPKDSFKAGLTSGEHVEVTPAGEDPNPKSITVNVDGQKLFAILFQASRDRRLLIDGGALV